MTAITATNLASPSVQADLLRSRVAAARREVERAQAEANSLRRQVDAQDDVVEKRQRRVKAAENAAQAPEAAQNTRQARVPTSDPTYLETLSEVFQAAKPVLESDLSPLQQNVFKSDLLERTDKAVYEPPSELPSPTPYQFNLFSTPNQIIGRLLNASA